MRSFRACARLFVALFCLSVGCGGSVVTVKIVEPAAGSSIPPQGETISVSLSVEAGKEAEWHPELWHPELWSVCYECGLSRVCSLLSQPKLGNVACDQGDLREMNAWMEVTRTGERLASHGVYLWNDPERALKALEKISKDARYWLHVGTALRQMGLVVRAAAAFGRAQQGAETEAEEALSALEKIEQAYSKKHDSPLLEVRSDFWATLKEEQEEEECAVPSRRSDSTMRLGFYGKSLTVRGTTVALFDYADLSERLLGHASPLVLYDLESPYNDASVIAKFQRRFELIGGVWDNEQIETLLLRENITHFIVLNTGLDDGLRLPTVRHCVLAIFVARTPHADRYARISSSIPGSDVPVIPFVVRPRQLEGPDLREELGIPKDAVVFGRHGGFTTFDIPAARQAVLAVARRRPDVYFILLNTEPLHASYNNVIYLPGTSDPKKINRYIRTCDAMLHGRLVGETFGLAIAEFSVMNKPVITSIRHGGDGTSDFHIKTLGSRGLYYHDGTSLEILLNNFADDRINNASKPPNPFEDWNAYRPFEPAAVMQAFKEAFLDDI